MYSIPERCAQRGTITPRHTTGLVYTTHPWQHLYLAPWLLVLNFLGSELPENKALVTPSKYVSVPSQPLHPICQNIRWLGVGTRQCKDKQKKWIHQKWTHFCWFYYEFYRNFHQSSFFFDIMRTSSFITMHISRLMSGVSSLSRWRYSYSQGDISNLLASAIA